MSLPHRPQRSPRRPLREPAGRVSDAPSAAEELALEVVSRASEERPADALLRQVLAPARRVPPWLARETAELVFAFYRWRGWLDPARSWLSRLRWAAELADRLAQDPAGLPEAELGQAVPAWIAGEVDFTADWLRSLQAPPTLWLRARPGQAAALALELGDAEPGGPLVPDAVRYLGEQDLFHHPAFREGRFEIQDWASQAVTVLAGPRPGEGWWDTCAGEGGKTLHLADLMMNRGVVWATDRAEWRLKVLRRRASRAGLFNIRWATWDGGGKRPGPSRHDAVLVDAPCSGVGTWQRNPHARWTLQPSDVAELAVRQLDLLKAAAPGVAPGGRLIYAVCTLTRSETTRVAEAFEQAVPGFEPLALPADWRRGVADHVPAHHAWLWPEAWGGNGMFVAAWRRVTTPA